jgi:hypothetical protein
LDTLYVGEFKVVLAIEVSIVYDTLIKVPLDLVLGSVDVSYLELKICFEVMPSSGLIESSVVVSTSSFIIS